MREDRGKAQRSVLLCPHLTMHLALEESGNTFLEATMPKFSPCSSHSEQEHPSSLTP